MNNRVELAREFAETINSKDIELIILFGSVARGDDTPDSDIDILIVSPIVHQIRKEINRIVAEIVVDKQELISTHLMTVKHFNETKDYPFLSNVLNESVILVG